MFISHCLFSFLTWTALGKTLANILNSCWTNYGKLILIIIITYGKLYSIHIFNITSCTPHCVTSAVRRFCRDYPDSYLEITRYHYIVLLILFWENGKIFDWITIRCILYKTGRNFFDYIFNQISSLISIKSP